ncbi:hypothetical protein C0991_000564 [Blastosporella zonata]|nr:hypothetical protein C0991_000564 [Blastosporella zonata]
MYGITGLVVGFPLDTGMGPDPSARKHRALISCQVKVRFQNPETAIKYRTTAHAISTIIREEKFGGLYKGITSPLVYHTTRQLFEVTIELFIFTQALNALLNGLVFASFQFFTKLQLDRGDDTPTLTQITLAGIGAGVAFSYVNCVKFTIF